MWQDIDMTLTNQFQYVSNLSWARLDFWQISESFRGPRPMPSCICRRSLVRIGRTWSKHKCYCYLLRGVLMFWILKSLLKESNRSAACNSMYTACSPCANPWADVVCLNEFVDFGLALRFAELPGRNRGMPVMRKIQGVPKECPRSAQVQICRKSAPGPPNCFLPLLKKSLRHKRFTENRRKPYKKTEAVPWTKERCLLSSNFGYFPASDPNTPRIDSPCGSWGRAARHHKSQSFRSLFLEASNFSSLLQKLQTLPVNLCFPSVSRHSRRSSSVSSMISPRRRASSKALCTKWKLHLDFAQMLSTIVVTICLPSIGESSVLKSSESRLHSRLLSWLIPSSSSIWCSFVVRLCDIFAPSVSLFPHSCLI